MPVMNGLEAAHALHQIMPRVPMILCSLHANDVLQREATAAGVKMVISKAENMQTLIKKAQELLETTLVSNPETRALLSSAKAEAATSLVTPASSLLHSR